MFPSLPDQAVLVRDGRIAALGAADQIAGSNMLRIVCSADAMVARLTPRLGSGSRWPDVENALQKHQLPLAWLALCLLRVLPMQ